MEGPQLDSCSYILRSSIALHLLLPCRRFFRGQLSGHFPSRRPITPNTGSAVRGLLLQHTWALITSQLPVFAGLEMGSIRRPGESAACQHAVLWRSHFSVAGKREMGLPTCCRTVRLHRTAPITKALPQGAGPVSWLGCPPGQP